MRPAAPVLLAAALCVPCVFAAETIRCRWPDAQRLVNGKDVAVDLVSGKRRSGRVTAVNESGATLRTSDGEEAFAAVEIRRVRIRSRRRTVIGVVLGVVAGAGVGAALAALGDSKHADYDLPAIIGGVAGGVIGRQVARRTGGVVVEIVGEPGP